jgi:hypothetical protein
MASEDKTDRQLWETAYTKKADWSRIPEHMHEGLLRYIEAGVPPGHFLEAVLCNDLKHACMRADAVNQQCLFDYIQFLYQYAPSIAWGSPQKYQEWIKRGGWTGVLAEKDLTELEKSERQKEDD